MDADEIECLASIFGEDFAYRPETREALIHVQEFFNIQIEFPESTSAPIHISHVSLLSTSSSSSASSSSPPLFSGLSEAELKDLEKQLTDFLQLEASQLQTHEGVCFSLVEKGKEWLSEKAKVIGDSKKKAPSPKLAKKKEPCKFFQKGTCKSGDKCAFQHIPASSSSSSPNTSTTTAPTKQQPSKKEDEGLLDVSKKPSMKTADDVIRRIQWDPEVPIDDISLGYEDRFIGIMEKKFSAFNWADFSSLSHKETAIPRHRIVFFKFRGVIIWDKRTRTDDVFGSVGGRRFQDILEDHGISTKDEASGHDGDDDEGEGHFPASSSGTKNAHHVEGDDDNDDEEDDGSEDSDGGSQARGFKNANRPNFFICFQVNDEKILKRVNEVQQNAIAYDYKLAEALIPLSALHFTLVTLRINTDEEMKTASRVMEESRAVFSSLLPPTLRLRVVGVDIFRDRVLHARLRDDHHALLTKFVMYLRERFAAEGIKLPGNHGTYTAHMTILKLNRKLAADIHHIGQGAYEAFKDLDFGAQNVESFHLCRMPGALGENGFYIPLCSVFNESRLFTQEQFENKLLPLIVSKHPRVAIILRGLPGSGKSFLSKVISKSLPDATICSADLFFTDPLTGVYTYDRTKLSDAHQSCQASFSAALAAGTPVIVDNTNVRHFEYRFYVDEARKNGFQVFLLEKQCPDAQYAEFFAQRNSHNVPLAHSKKMFENWDQDRTAYVITPAPLNATSSSASKVSPLLMKKNLAASDKITSAGLVPAYGPQSGPQSSGVRYIGIFLTPDAKENLRARFTPAHPNVFLDHVTLCFNPSASVVAASSLGQECEVHILSELRDSKGQALLVRPTLKGDAVTTMNNYPHVTVSCADGVNPVYSNELIANQMSGKKPFDFEPICIVKGVIGAALGTVSGPGGRTVYSIDDVQSFVSSLKLRDPGAMNMGAVAGALPLVLQVFDFDGTLFDTVDPEVGKALYWKHFGRSWPHTGFVTHPESLLSPMPVTAGPVFPLFNAFNGRAHTLTVVMTGRIDALRPEVYQILRTAGCVPDRLIMKPKADDDTVAFKVDAISKLILEFPSIKEIKLWDDDTEVITAMHEQARVLKASEVDLKANDVAVVKDQLKKLASGQSVVSSFFVDHGLLPSDVFRIAATEGISFLESTWRAAADIISDAPIVLQFGSFPLGRFGDVDLCFLAPPSMTQWQAVQLLASGLANKGVRFTYAAESNRCPRLKVKLFFTKHSPIDYDIIFLPSGHLDASSVPALVSIFSNDSTKMVALAGPVFCEELLSFTEATPSTPVLIKRATLARLIDGLKFLLHRYNLHGNAFHFLRTFHIAQLVKKFVLSSASPSSSNSSFPSPSLVDLDEDATFLRFLEYWGVNMDREVLEELATQEKNVAAQYFPHIISFFRKISAAAKEHGLHSIFEWSMTASAVAFPPPNSAVVKISFSSEDSVLLWQLETYLHARLPTYTRRLMILHPEILVYADCGSLDHVGLIRFAVSIIPDVRDKCREIFSVLLSELKLFLAQGASCRFTFGHDEAPLFDESAEAPLDTESMLLCKRLQDFAADATQSSLSLPKLSNFQRFLIHERAEKMGLIHQSEGKGANRTLVIRKRDQ